MEREKDRQRKRQRRKEPGLEKEREKKKGKEKRENKKQSFNINESLQEEKYLAVQHALSQEVTKGLHNLCQIREVLCNQASVRFLLPDTVPRKFKHAYL